MGAKVLSGLAACLLLLGLAGIVFAGDMNHKEPTSVTSTCGTASATVSWAAVSDDHLSGYDVYKKLHTDVDYVRANTQLVSATTYSVTGLSSSATYDFAVMAMYNDGHRSNLSTPASCTTG